jgi:membrane protease subunit (stomatin/prohibitin family)
VAPPGSAASAAARSARVASGPSKAEQEAAAREQQQQKQQAARQKEEEQRLAAQRRDNCARAQASMRDLQSGIRLTRTNEQGERVFLDDSQRRRTGAHAPAADLECR